MILPPLVVSLVSLLYISCMADSSSLLESHLSTFHFIIVLLPATIAQSSSPFRCRQGYRDRQ